MSDNFKAKGYTDDDEHLYSTVKKTATSASASNEHMNQIMAKRKRDADEKQQRRTGTVPLQPRSGHSTRPGLPAEDSFGAALPFGGFGAGLKKLPVKKQPVKKQKKEKKKKREKRPEETNTDNPTTAERAPQHPPAPPPLPSTTAATTTTAPERPILPQPIAAIEPRKRSQTAANIAPAAPIAPAFRAAAPISPLKQKKTTPQPSHTTILPPPSPMSSVDSDAPPSPSPPPSPSSSKPKLKGKPRENFVRLNMKGGGSSALVRPSGKGKKSKRGAQRRLDGDDGPQYGKFAKKKAYTARRLPDGGVDILDDLLDGKFKEDGKPVPKTKAKKTTKQPSPDDICCVRHSRKCKLCTVKKSGPNKGKKFYVCSLPRGEGCDFFKWEMDTGGGVVERLKKGKTKEGYMARVMAGWRLRVGKLTIAELQIEWGARITPPKGKTLKSLTKTKMLDLILAIIESEVEQGLCGDFEPPPALPTVDSDSESDLELVPDDNLSSDDERFDDEIGPALDDSDSEPDDAPAPKNSKSVKPKPAPPPAETLDLKDPTSVLRHVFNHTSFRPGQAWAINRVLGGQRSLLVAATGGGKSLAYALPAMMLPGVTIVVSPLIALAADQQQRLPPRVASASLTGSLTQAEQAVLIDDLCRGRIKVLFVSPERLTSAAFKRLLRPSWNAELKTMERRMPPVSLLCVDESHLASTWSHSFRPSFLRIKGVLAMLEPSSVLALTATAGGKVIDDICTLLDIPPIRVPPFEDMTIMESDNKSRGDVDMGVRVLSGERRNIDPAAIVLENDDAKRAVLLKMLLPVNEKRSASELDKKMASLSFTPGCMSEGSVIIYVWTRNQAESLADLLKNSGVEGGVVYYHGRLSASERASAQSRFMRDKARICVATIAFGLGIDKANVAAVVHTCLPGSIEHYTQEIGRAGRSGAPAIARAIVTQDDAVMQLSLAHSNGVSRTQIEQFVGVIDKAFAEVKSDGVPIVGAAQISVPVLESVNMCDLREEQIETLLSLLEENDFGNYLLLDGSLSDRCIVTLKKRTLEALAPNEVVCQAILKCGVCVKDGNANKQLEEWGGTAADKGFHAYAHGNWAFSIVRAANLLGTGAQPRHVYAALRRLEWAGELETNLTEGVTGKGFLAILNQRGLDMFDKGEGERGEVKEKSRRALIERLYYRMKEQETMAVEKVQQIFDSLVFMTTQNEAGKSKVDDVRREERVALLTRIGANYFGTGDVAAVGVKAVPVLKQEIPDGMLRSVIRDVTHFRNDDRLDASNFGFGALSVGDPSTVDYGARAISNLLQGITLARTPNSMFWNDGGWGKWKEYEYSALYELCVSLLEKDMG